IRTAVRAGVALISRSYTSNPTPVNPIRVSLTGAFGAMLTSHPLSLAAAGPAPDVPAGGNEACQRSAARFGRERLRRALSGLLHDAALDQLEAIGLGQDPVLHHLVVLIDGQSFRGRAHDPAPPESTAASLAAFLASRASYHAVNSALAVRQVSSDSASLFGSMVNH